jgi:hypothetical protein
MGKAVLAHRIYSTLDSVSGFPDTSDYRKEDRRAPSPESRIALPQIFCFTFPDALEFSTVRAYLNPQFSIG